MIRSVPFLISVLLLAVVMPVSAAEPTVVPGYRIESAIVPELTTFPMFATFDSEGRLYVAESSGLDLYAELQAQTRKCRIRRLEDTDNDGVFESSTVFADHLVFPMGLAWKGGKLFVADPPDLAVYQDLNDDGKADTRHVILSGFGHLDNGSLHGLIFGPDQKLYMTMGEPDGYQLPRSDGTILHGKTGALIRCNVDGTDPEVISRGFVNLVEIIFTQAGEVIGSDNWFSLPIHGVRDALVHLLPGGLYPLHTRDSGTPLLFTGEQLPALEMFPAVAISGIVRYEGGHLEKSSEEMLFSAMHNSRKVMRHELSWKGRALSIASREWVGSQDPDFHPSDVVQDSDGSILIVDTGGWYVQHCPTGKIRDSRSPGGIYRVTSKNGATLKDPWGRAIDWTNMSIESLVEMLADPRWAVREKAAAEVQARPAAAFHKAAKKAFHSSRSAELKIQILNRQLAPEILPSALNSKDDLLVVTALRNLPASLTPSIQQKTVDLLLRGSERVQFAALEVLGNSVFHMAPEILWKRLRSEGDPNWRHLFIRALSVQAATPSLQNKSKTGAAEEQLVALVLLEQRNAVEKEPLHLSSIWERVSERSKDKVLFLLEKHPDWTASIRGMISRHLESSEPTEALKNLIALALKNQQIRNELLTYLPSAPLSRRAFLLNAIAENPVPTMPETWKQPLELVLNSTEPMLQEAVLNLVRAQRWDIFDGMIESLSNRAQASESLRLLAVEALAHRGRTLPDSTFGLFRSRLATDPGLALMLAKGFRLTDTQILELLKKIRPHPAINPADLLRSEIRDQAIAASAFKELAAMAAEGRLSEVDWRRIKPFFKVLPQDAFSEMEKMMANRPTPEKLIQQYAHVLAGGEAKRGKEIFVSKGACAACHTTREGGSRIGPDLSRIGSIRSPRDLLESILVPSSTFAQGYETFQAELDGDVIEGIMLHEYDDAVVLRDAAGKDHQFFRNRIRSLKKSDVSIMPEGLHETLTEQELGDLIAYLMSLQ